MKFCLTVKTEQQPDVRTGSKVLVEIGAGSPVACTVSGVTDGKPPGYSVISGAIGYLSPDRYVRACHALPHYRRTGIIVPVRAWWIRTANRRAPGQKTYAVFHPVEVRMIKGDRAVVQGISETSEIVLKGMKFLEGRRVR